ncbi:D-isomer specific 2-hydroxyacid dehydrogenase [Bordetella ansorpii]|uniref:D-isomer specific 2-hydroxyacid dehydrogenase n=1 Tax=Bordetella ansorpii TaxID=288768 RepID=A0A157NZU0_9BORD|nr:2-hydroxyacid dehydrogenase [Bordetella ansorpii]SAI26600.1 D-isomer specific 2-hydroxyacid dehydrogenase [Bordetella ansorpii]
MPVATDTHDAMKEPIPFKIESPPHRDVLREDYDVKDLDALSPEECARARVVVTSGFVGLSRGEIDRLPRLGMISCIGTGYENVDLDAARERGIVVSHGAGSNASGVADHAMAMLLAMMRNIPAFDASAKQGLWRGTLAPRPMPGGKTLGIIGMGQIGERIARRAAAFDMEVLYHSRTPKPELQWEYVPSVMALAERCDILVMAAPGGRATFRMIGADVLRALGPSGFLVNIGRGPNVDTDALVAALRSGGLAGAALDVFETEPEIPASLRELDNVLLTPHVAAFAPEMQTLGSQLLRKNIDAYFGSGRPVTPIPEMA